MFTDKAQAERNLRFPCQTISNHISSVGKTEMILLCFLCVRMSERAALWPSQCFICLTKPRHVISPAETELSWPRIPHWSRQNWEFRSAQQLAFTCL